MDGREHEIEAWTVNVDADLTGLKNEIKIASDLGRRFASSLTNAFEGVATRGKGLRDVFKDLALELSRATVKAAFRPLEQGLSSAFGGIVAGTGSTLVPAAPLASALPLPFAKGGVIQSPVGFPLAGGKSGIAGERGAEAILPLGRASDGRLGVVSQTDTPMSVVVNITTPDIESFTRSQTQVAATLTRALSAGKRNL